MHKLSFVQKLWMPLIISIIGLLLVGGFNAYQARNLQIEDRKADVVHANEIALSIVKQYAAYAASGAMTKDEAQKQALERIKSLRYGKDGYISVSDFDNHTVMHPLKPDLVGKDLKDVKDGNGFAVFAAISETARNSDSGFVSYVWPHAAGGEPAPKISSVMAYRPWQWALVTGAYIDDVNSAVLASLASSSLVLLAIVAILAIFITFSVRGIQRQIGGDPAYASAVAKHIAAGNLSTQIETGPGDQDSLLAHMKNMRDSLVKTIHGITSSPNSKRPRWARPPPAWTRSPRW
jgi:methyl-accepting chemotaxis protein